MHPMLPSGASTPRSGTPTFPIPHRGQTTPTPTTAPPPLHQLRPVHSDAALASRVNLPITPNEKPRVPKALEELHQGLNYPEGEMAVSLWVLIKPSRAHDRRPSGPRER